MYIYRARQQIRVLLALLMFAVVPQVSMSADSLVKGTFRPDRLNPQNNKFDFTQSNTSPSGYCSLLDYNFCASRNFYELTAFQGTGGVRRVGVPVNSGNLKVSGDGSWRSVDIVSATGDHNTVLVRVAGVFISIAASRNPNTDPLTGWRSWVPADVAVGSQEEAFRLIFGHGAMTLGSCVGPNLAPQVAGYTATGFIALFSPGANNCVAQNQYDIELRYAFNSPQFFIEVLSPNPLSMKAGDYTGNISYRVGAGGDIDLGAVNALIDPVHNVNFELSVVHDFGIQFPGGSNLLSLVPEGGWMAWLQRGRKPARLFRDQTFELATSASFRMSVSCGHPEGASCGIRNGSGHQVPVDISVTLPKFRDASNQPVNKYPLTDVPSPSFKYDGYYVGRATLHFEVPKHDMETMLDHPGSRYSGNVTVMFEPEL